MSSKQLDKASGAPLGVEGLGAYGTHDIFAEDGRVCLWLPEDMIPKGLVVQGVWYRFVGTEATPMPPGAVFLVR